MAKMVKASLDPLVRRELQDLKDPRVSPAQLDTPAPLVNPDPLVLLALPDLKANPVPLVTQVPLERKDLLDLLAQRDPKVKTELQALPDTEALLDHKDHQESSPSTSPKFTSLLGTPRLTRSVTK